MDETCRKARLYDLQFEVERQMKRVEASASEARAKTNAWLRLGGGAFDLYNVGEGVRRVRAALDALEVEHRRLLALINEQNELKGA